MGKLSDLLGVPVVGTSEAKGLNELMGMVSKVANKSIMNKPLQIKYPESIEDAIEFCSLLFSKLLAMN